MQKSLCAAVAFLTTMAVIGEVRAEAIGCTIARGNLCFPTSCSNSARTERISLDVVANTYSFCPRRNDDRNCITAPMSFAITDTSIIGVSNEGPEASARSVFLNRNTGSLTTSLLSAGGVVSIGFGNCQRGN
jgi:hypothetical protein